MRRKLTCIICPRGCSLSVDIDGECVTVTGHGCNRGEQYGVEECIRPTRTITSSIRVANRPDKMVSVKTAAPIPKDKIQDMMAHIRAATVNAPVQIGEIILHDLFDTVVVATSSVE